jgi:hypothetical protein
VTELPKAKSGEDAADGALPTSAATPEGLGDTVVQISRISAKEPVKPSLGHGRPGAAPRKNSNAAKLGLTPESEASAPKPSIPKPVRRPTIADDLDAAFGKTGDAATPANGKPNASAVPPKAGSPVLNAGPTRPPVAPRTPVTVREAGESAGSASLGNPAPRPTVSNPRRTRKARLRVARVDPWSVMKTVFLFSIAYGIMTWVATYLLWQILLASGLFAAMNDAVVTIVSSPNNTEGWRIEDYLSANKVLGVTAVLAAVNVIITTALGTLGAFLYNLSANILGGLELTLAED